MGYKHLTREQRYKIEVLFQTLMTRKKMKKMGSTAAVTYEIWKKLRHTYTIDADDNGIKRSTKG